jgi:hypothetical protein
VTELRVAVRQRLLSVAEVSALVSTRVYPTVLPQAAVLPAITYRRVDGFSDLTATTAGGYEQDRLQLDSWAQSASQAQAVAKAVRDALHGFAGDVSGVRIGIAQVIPGPELHEKDVQNSDGTRGRHGVSEDFIVSRERTS